MQLVDARELLRRRCARASARSARRSAPTQIDEITRLYGDFTEGDKVKIFPNEAFGFLRITVERPLRVRWEITDDTLAAVEADAEGRQARRRRPDDAARVASARRCRRCSTESSAAAKLVRLALADAGLKGKPLETAVLGALAVRDPEAEPITDAKGNAEPDPDLRDNENVPLPDAAGDVRGRRDRPAWPRRATARRSTTT